MRFSKSTVSMLAISCGIFLAGPAYADILHVPGDFPTIQAAIDAAVDGDPGPHANPVFARNVTGTFEAPTAAAETAGDPRRHAGDSGATCTHPLFVGLKYGAGDSPSSVAIGDLDGVNGPDLAVANRFSDDVSVLLNQGDGTFAPAVAYAAGDRPISVAIGDLDGVNGPDLAVANVGVYDFGCECFVNDDVSVLLNNGDGTFAAAVAYTAGSGPSSVVIGDLDGVNGPDLAVTYFGVYDPGCACIVDDDVLVLLNNGDGTFALPVAYAAGDAPTSVAIGDLDGVNGPDLAVANAGSDDVSVLLNQDDGTFAPAVAYEVGALSTSVAIGDLDGVNGPDLVLMSAEICDGKNCSCFGVNAVSVLLNQGGGTFAPAVVYDVVGYESQSVAIGDLDGVNGPDLAVTTVEFRSFGCFVCPGANTVSVLLNQGDGTFAAAVAYNAGNAPRSVAIGDLDGVNGPDLAVANKFSDDVSVLLNLCGSCPTDLDGDGQVRVPDLIIMLAAWGPNPGHPADLDGNGEVRVPDLIILLGAWGLCN